MGVLQKLDRDQMFDVLVSALEHPENLENLDIARRIILTELGLSIEDPLMLDIIVHPFFIASLVLEKFDDYWKAEHASQIIDQTIRVEGPQVTMRRFASEGSLCYGLPLIAETTSYQIYNGHPYLFTMSDRRTRVEESYKSEIGVFLPLEIKALAALSFSSPASHGPTIAFIPAPGISAFPIDFLFGKNPPFTVEGLKRARLAIILINNLESERVGSYEHGVFHFQIEDVAPSRVRKFLSSFDESNLLLLRTASLYLKAAALLRSGNIFFEEAAVNLYIGIEGCLRLISKNRGQSEINYEDLKALLRSKFHEDYATKELIEEIYEKRLQIVHPDNLLRVGWVPEIQVDDFYEHYAFGVYLLYYAVTGELLPPHYDYHLQDEKTPLWS